MKSISLVFTACLVVILCGKVQAQKPHLDIILEGPWVLYEDHNVFATAHMSVLVAMAPNVSDQTKPHTFHYPLILAGDGYAIYRNGIYCLFFDSSCGRTGFDKLTSDGYPAGAILAGNVQSPTKFNWPAVVANHGNIALILPMPDSYSNDEIWPMRFGPVFDASGATYTTKSTNSIGLQLHYADGPKTINVMQCPDPPTAPTPDNCKFVIPADHSQLANTGTLRIVMKAPDSDGSSVCDHHVRNTYPQMLGLLDGSNDNLKIIDPARAVKADGTGDYDDSLAKCLGSDPQDPHSPKLSSSAAHLGSHRGSQGLHSPKRSSPAAPSDSQTLKGQLGNIVSDLGFIAETIHKNPSLPGAVKEMESQIRNSADQISNEKEILSDNVPRLSQLDTIRLEVQSSASQMNTLAAKLEVQMKSAKEATGQDKIQSRGSRTSAQQIPEQMLLNRSRKVQRAAASFVDGIPTKDGKDCRAPLMLITQP